MKKFLIGLLTIIMTFAIITLGVVLNLKSTIVDTIGKNVKEEVTNSLVDTISKETGTNNKKLKKDIADFINENPEIEKITSIVIDKTIDVLSEETKKIKLNIADEIDTILDETEDILQKYDVTLTKEARKEITKIAESGELNDILNDALNELESEETNEFRVIADILKFVNNDLKTITIGIIIISLILIIILKKSIYKWLSYAGTSLILTGLTLGFICPFLINLLNKAISEEITISIDAIKTFGYISLIVGIIFIIINKILSHTLTNKTPKEVNNEPVEKTKPENNNEEKEEEPKNTKKD